MNTYTSRFRRYLITGLLSSLFPCSICLATRDEEVGTPPSEESRHRMESALEVLWSGSPEEKRDLVEEAGYRLDYLGARKAEDEEARSAVEWLRTVLRTEKDEWVLNRL